MHTLPHLGIGDCLGTNGGSAPAYQILETLGSGGVGRIYRARLLASGEMVVIKTPRTWRLVADVMHEARFLLRESFPHVAHLRDVDTAWLPELRCEVPFIVMDAYRGSICDVLCEGPAISARSALSWIAQCARGLQASTLLHRDLKPENILLDDQGRAVVCDFGLAVPASPIQRRSMGLEIDQMMGTAAYMSPEQICEVPDIDERADIYALGLILFELLTGLPGHPLYHGQDLAPEDYLSLVCAHEVAWRDVQDARLAELVRTCTRKRRRERFDDYWSLLEAIAAARSGLPGCDDPEPPVAAIARRTR